MDVNTGVLPVACLSSAVRAGEPDSPSESPGGGDTPDNGGNQTAILTRTKTRTKRPGMYRVLLLNDDYTPMDFVVAVLCHHFHKDHDTATQIMLQIHHHGVGECGVFTCEVAETRVAQVMDFSRKHLHPLQCIMEKV
jgi:ATP-dependent Clp protease adaptor protein ClpS